MTKLLMLSALALALAGPAQARNIRLVVQSSGSTCAGLHLTAYQRDILDPQPIGCCDHRRNCPRYLSIKPAETPHPDLRT